MFSKQKFKIHQYGWVQNWIFLDCHFMRNFNFFLFWFNGKTCQNVSFSYDTSSVFHSTPIIAFEFWNLKKQRKTGGRKKMCQSHLLFPPLPQTHESALANSAFSSVVIGIGILVYYYFHAIVGTFLAGPCGDVFFPVPTPDCRMQPPLPTEGEVLHIFCLFFVNSHFCCLWGIWATLLIEILEVMEAAALCRLWGILLIWGTELWSFRLLCTVGAVPKMNSPQQQLLCC